MHNNIISGKVFVFGKNIDTDQIYPGRFVELTDVVDVAKYAMHGADPDFVNRFSTGDIIVAQSNFGCGSSREHAAVTLKAVGVGAVIADSFARIFYRNAINLGLPLIVCKGISAFVKEGELLNVDLASGKIMNESSGASMQAGVFSDYTMHILASGGIKPLIKKQLAEHAKAL